MKKFKTIESIAAVISIENIDTDQIIGSDHLKITDKQGLGKHLFSDWRYLADGKDDPSFVLNQASTKNAKVLIAGDNFACGSSREHAPWALLDYGIEVIVSSSIADIFSNNAVKNGLLPIEVDKNDQQFLLQQNEQPITVNLDQQLIHCNGKKISFKVQSFVKYCLQNGIEQMDFLLDHLDDINAFEQQRAS